MMSSATTQRAGRAPKDKNKPQPVAKAPKPPVETVKTSTDNVVAKIQPTAEQLRIAQIINDANKAAYPDLKDKVERIIEITGRTTDAALVALHDCDNDSNRAAIMLLEGNQDEGKWETTSKKKKKPQPKVPEVNGHEAAPVEKEEKEAVDTTNRRRDSKPRDGNYRYRGPPRMNRGNQQGGRNWRNKENEKNERNLQTEGGEGSTRRGRGGGGGSEGRSRGPRKNFTSGRGRGRGGRSRTFQNRGLQSNDGFPESIETWNNSTAEKVSMSNPGDSTMTVGNWSDVAVTEEWSEEDWSENLTETKVFTPSGSNQSSSVTGIDIPTATVLSQNMDLASFLQKASSNTNESNSNALSSSSNISQQSSLMSQQQTQPSSLMSQQQTQPSSLMSQQQTQQSHFDFTQFAKQAADQIKAAVGVVSTPNTSSLSSSSYQSNSQSYQPSGYSSATLQQTTYPPSMHSPPSQQQNASTNQKGSTVPQPLPQRSKPQTAKARLPPPSKIPESAVVMPDDAATSLDVQFGALQFGTDSSPFDFTATDSSNTYQDLGQSSNGSSQLSSQQSNMTSQSSYGSNALPSPVTMSKESTYASMGSHPSPIQNELTPSQKVASQDSMLLSQSEHKNSDVVSSFVNHRTNQPSNLDGSLISSKAQDSSPLNSFTPSHDSTYSYAGSVPKPVLNVSSLVPSTAPYSHPSSLSTSDLQTTQPKYQAQGGGATYGSSSSYGLQQAAYSSSVTTSGSTYPTGYNSHVSSSYGTNNSGYNSQQNVYSGSVTTTAQSGSSMISTSVSNSKLSNSLNHGVKDSSSLMEAQHSSSQHAYDVSSSVTTSIPASVNHSQNMNASVLGLVSTSSQTTTTSVLKNSLSATGKPVPNVPQNMPAMLGHQYIMGQASLPFYGLQQPAVYSYEEMQMLQSKLSTMGYYDVPFQAPTSMTSRDPAMGSVSYTADQKYSRAETDASSVATTLSQASTHAAQGQAFLNPTLPPGYGYYFAGGMMTGGIHHYAPPIFPVPPATNTHGATTNTQFQKANAYGSHSYSSGYETLSQAQDYTKGTYGAASQSQVKGVSGSGAVADLSGSVYSKTHAQLAKYNDKPGFHGTPPPFNMAGSQTAGPLGASSGPYAAQFIPVLQHHNTLLHHHMQQDATGNTGGQPSSGQRSGQQKPSSKQNYAYWATN